MKQIRTSLNLSKKQKQFLLIILFLGILIGFLLYKKIDQSLVIDNITNIESTLENNRINFLFMHLIVLSLLIESSTLMIGIVLFPIYFIMEIATITYSILCFSNAFQISGVLYGIIYNIITKGFYIILLIILTKNIYKIAKMNITTWKNKGNHQIDSKEYKKIAILSLSILVYDLFLYLLGSKILLKLSFIIS